MARSVRAKIETRSARSRLPGRKEPYWQKIERGLSAGYHRPSSGGAGTWWARVRLADGRYRIASLATADDHLEANGETVLSWSGAQAAVRAWAARQTGHGPLTVADACAAYIADLRARKGDGAARSAEGRIATRVLPTLGQSLLADLTPADITAWRNRLVKDENTSGAEAVRRSRDTANRLFNILRAAANHAFRLGRVADDRPWRKVKPFRNVGRARQIILSDDELQRLVDACEPDLSDLVLAAIWSGARLGELTARVVSDVDVRNAVLHVRSGKTGARTVHLAPDMVVLLRRLAHGKAPDDFLFRISDGRPWTKNRVQHRFTAAVTKAGLDRATVFYSLRHSHISRALVAGVPIRAIAESTGTSVAMIEKNYAKFVPDQKAAYAAMAAAPLRVGSGDKVVALRPGAA